MGITSKQLSQSGVFSGAPALDGLLDVQSVRSQRMPCLVSCAAVAILKFSITFKQKASHQLPLYSADYVASPVQIMNLYRGILIELSLLAITSKSALKAPLYMFWKFYKGHDMEN